MAATQDKGSSSPTIGKQEDAGEVKTGDQTADLGSPNPDVVRERAEDLVERTDVEKAYKKQLTADDAQDEAKASLRISELSIDSPETPSGYGLRESVGESNDTKRGEKYARAKTARRWGYVPADEKE